MAYPLYTLDTIVPVVGAMPAAFLQAEVAAIPLPLDQVESLGAFVLSDATAAGPPVDRTTVIRVTAPTAAVVAPHLIPGQSGSGIESVTVTGAGTGYVRPPVILPLEPGQNPVNSPGKGARFQAYLKLVPLEGGAVTRIAGGAHYAASTVVGAIGGLPPGRWSDQVSGQQDGADDFLGTLGVDGRTKDPHSVKGLNAEACVNFLTVVEQGANYTAATVIQFLGAEPNAGGRPPLAFPVIVAGKIVGVQMVDPGLGFTGELEAVAFDPGGGTGAVLSVSMMHGRPAQLAITIMGGVVTAVTVVDPGDGYVSVPQIVVFDPTGAGSGAKFTVDSDPATSTPPLLGVSRVDVLATGEAYDATVTLTAMTLFEAAYFASITEGDLITPGKAFRNLLRTSVQQLVATQVTENIS